MRVRVVGPTAIGALCIAASCSQRLETAMVSIDEPAMRRVALVRPMPTYPYRSLSQGVGGIAVIAITINPSGSVQDAQILQAPDAQTGSVAMASARRWTFPPAKADRKGRHLPAAVATRLTFLFQAVPPRGRVLLMGEDGAARSGGGSRGGALIPIEVISDSELARLRTVERVAVIDIRSRGDYGTGHRSDSVNLPAEELGVRVWTLDGVGLIVIDCSRGAVRACNAAARQIATLLPSAAVRLLVPLNQRGRDWHESQLTLPPSTSGSHR